MKGKWTLGIALLLTTIVLSAKPLASFEENENWKRHISVNSNVRSAIVQEHAFDGKNSLKLDFTGSKKDTWPGFLVYFNKEDMGDNTTLHFNAWHESSSNITLSVRIDYKGYDSQFAGITVLPRSRASAMLFLNQRDSKGNLIIPTRVLIYQRMPRVNSTLWFDNFRFAPVPPSGTPASFVPPKGHRKPTPSELALGAQFFRRPWMEHVFPNVLPLPSDSTDVVIDVTACPGETEPATLSLHALKGIAAASLSVPAPLAGPAGASIPSSAVTVYNIRCLDKRRTYQSNTYYREIPMVLDRAPSFPVIADQTHSFWLDIAVPAGTPAGTYRGTARVALDDATQDIPLVVNVRPFTLPAVTKQFFGEYYTCPRGFSKEELPKIIDGDFAFMRGLGMTSVGLCISPDVTPCKYADGKVTIDFKESDPFVYVMNAYLKYGYPCPVILLSDPGFGFAQANGGTDNVELLNTLHHAYWTAMQEECRKRGWPELIIQPVDEPSWQSQDSKDRNVMMLKMLKNVPGLRTEQDGPADSYFFNTAGPLADVWCFNGGLAAPERMEKVYADGKLALFYNCDVESYRPVIGRYSAGFFQYLSKCHGLMNWAYRSFGGSPFNDFDSARGDTTNYYPTFGDIVGGPGVGLVATREGIDDFRYVQLLQELIASRPGPAADEAKRVLDSILKSIVYSPELRNTATFSLHPAGADNMPRITGVLNVPNGWLLTDYDCAREIIANQIQKLLGTDGAAAAVKPVTLAVMPAPQIVAATDDAAESAICSVVIPTCTVVPNIDGKLDDVCWEKAGRIGDFQLITGGKPDQQTTAWLTTDGTNLYIGVKCDEPIMDHLVTNVKQHQGPVYSDDCVEIFLDPEHKGKEYLQLCVNSAGYTFIETSGRKWTPQLKTAGRCEKDHWCVEIAIPLKSLGRRANSIGLNICRERRPLEVFELSCWSPTGDRFATPSRFGSATFGHAWLRRVSLDNLMLGNGSIAIDVVNPALNDDPVTVVGECTLTCNGKPQPAQTFTQTVVPKNGTATITQPLALSREGDVLLTLSAKNAKGAVVEKVTLQKAILPAITLEMKSPFIDSGWQGIVNVNYLPGPGDILTLDIWADSAPANRVSLDTKGQRRFILTVDNGNFQPLDRVNLQLANPFASTHPIGLNVQQVLTR